MESCQNFLEILKQDISERNLKSIIEILNNYEKYFESISIEHVDSTINSLFDERNGLLCFLKESLYEAVNHQKTKFLDDALKGGFNFLDFFIKNFYTTSCFTQYIHQIKDVCQQTLTIKCTLYVKKAACVTFKGLIKLFKDHDLKLDETADKLFKLFDRIDIKERRLIFCIIAKILKYTRISPLLQKHLNNIFKQLCRDAEEEFVRQSNPGTGFKDFYIYFKVYVTILDFTGLKLDQIKGKLSTLYKYIKYYSQPKKDENNKSNNKLRKWTMKLLSYHIKLFQDLLYPDCKYWYDEVLRHLSRQTVNYSDDGQNALKAIYRIIGQILMDESKEDVKDILSYFLNDFEKEFQNTDLNLITLRLLVYGYSRMAEPCKVHLYQLEIRRMYSTITSCSLSLCSSEQSDSAHVENVYCYQEALSDILCHMSDITIEKINVLAKFSVYTIKRFPDLIESKNPLAISALVRTISNLGITNRNLLQRYLDSIIYDGVAWSCSHTLAVDVELQWEQNNLRQRPVCYKNYLPLWTELLNAHRYRIGEREQLAQYVANTLMDVCIALIDRLDIRVEEASGNVAHSNALFAENLAVNQADFRVFTNLVDFYVDVIDASESLLFANTVHRFLYEMIRLSYKHPLVSGFYKLVRVGMKIVATLEDEENSGELRQTREFLSNYLTYTLDLFPAFSNELLIAYLHLILNAPLAYIADALPRMLPVFKIAFTVGLSNLELAYTALATLEVWTMSQKLEPEQRDRTNQLLHEVVIYLEPYLRSTQSSVEISQDLTTETTARRSVKRIHVIDTECTLQNFQRRVLLFLGSLGHGLLSSFVHERASRNLVVSWDRKCLKYSLPLPDARPDIYFDRALPRIIALARDSSDRRTKIAACEVLHSIATLVIGNTARHLVHLTADNSFIALYGVLCPTMLALGCDFDEAVRNLFQPLTLQLIHWLSSKPTLTSPVISYLLDSLFDGLTDDSNPALRDFSGKCLGEFTSWLFQEADTREIRLNVRGIVQRIIQRINYLALHPSTRKRVAAAVAFNHLYRILREDNEIVSIYWLEIFYCFVRSSDGCDDLSITNALAHVERVTKAKADLLNINESRRRKPREFDNATLTHALYWLLSQCGALDERYRSKCMKLYIDMSEYNDNHAQKTTQDFIVTYGLERLNGIVLGGLELYEDVSEIDNPTPLLKVLDCYVWLIKKPSIENPAERRLLSAEELFPAVDADEHATFSHIRNFAQQFWHTIAESSVETSTMKSREVQTLQMLRCKTLMTTLDFVRELLNANILPESLWEEEALCALTIKCTMHPRAVGFDVRNIEMTSRLPCVLETLLNSMRSEFGDALPNTFKTRLSHFIRKYLTGLDDLHYIMQSDSCNEMIQHVKGLILLERCNVLDRTILQASAFGNGGATINQIFDFLVSEHIGELTCNDLSAQMIEYLNALMEFQFSQLSSTLETPVLIFDADTRSMIEKLVELISRDTPITGLDSASITHGEYFLNTFRSVIFKYMLANLSAITDIAFGTMSRNNPSFLLKWAEDLLLFLKRHRRELKDHVNTAVRAILRQFTCLKNTIGEIDSRRERLMNIYGVAVRLNSEIAREFPELRQWILNQLSGNGDLEYKILILRNFLVCLTDAPDCDDEKLSGILNTLKTNEAAKQVSCFETLLTLLSSTKSIITLKCAIRFAAGAGARLFNEKLEEHLRRYYHDASSEYVLQSLEMTYHEFMNTETKDGTERLDVLRGFLLSTFEFCDTVAIERFFERNVRELNKIAKEAIDNKCDDVAIKRSLLSKIGCFQLIAIMSARARNVFDKITTGEELHKSLLQNAVNTRDVRITRSECKELARLMHCSAYNCLLALISMKKNEKIYRMAFGKNKEAADSRFIWEMIVDCDKLYKLGQTVEEYPKIRETIVNVRSADDEHDARVRGNSHVHTFDLSACTLSEDINAYDLNRCTVLPYGSRYPASQDSSQGVTSVALESDDFNEHECMPHICALLQRARRISGDEEPLWLRGFLQALRTLKEPNIRLFLLKIISNTADVFKYYAKFALSAIIQSTAAYLERHDLNYIITDILEILMEAEVVPSDDAGGNAKAQRLFDRFVDKIMTKKSVIECVNEYNLRLMSNMVRKWRGCLRVPAEFVQKMSSAQMVAAGLILAFFENDITEEVIASEEVVNFLLQHTIDWSTTETEKTSLDCCKCLGLYLKHLDGIIDNENERESRRRDLTARIFNILSSRKEYKYVVQQVKCIVALCQFYPEAAASHVALNIAINAMAKRLETSSCLEIFRLAVARLSAVDVVSYLRSMQLQRVLENRMHCETLALRVVHELVVVLSPVDLLPYVDRAVHGYIKDSSTEYRELVYDILRNIYNKYSADIAADDDTTVRKLLSISVENLLAGLQDPSRELQEKILRFWAEETSLGTQRTKDRLLALLDMHSSQRTTSEDVFALLVALLMLQLSTKSTEYNKKIFDAPLHYNCTFRDHRIEVSWRRRNLSSVTPMFVQSFASQAMTCGTFSQSVDDNVTRSHFSHDAARQDRQFEPTLDEDVAAVRNVTFGTVSTLDAVFDRAATTPNRSRQGATIVCGKRFPRFLVDSCQISKNMRYKNYQKNKRRIEMVNQENVRQRSSVKLNNNYRIGNYPDIEITHSSLIVPLQQLIKLDRLFCKHMTVFLLESLSQEMIERENSNDFRQAIVEKLKRILHDSCDKESSFNAIILETFLNLKVTNCDTRDIIKASKANGLDVLGLFLLEHFLCDVPDVDVSSPTSSKKMRIQDNYVKNEKIDRWAQLASFYKSLNDVDIVLSIFRERPFLGEDVQEAALAEANGDWIGARDAFSSAFEQSRNSSMKEHCLQGLLEAVTNLCDWSEIDRLVKSRSDDGNLNDLWDNAWKDWMIPYAFDGYVHMTADGTWTNDQDLTTIQSWMCNPEKLEHLESLAGEALIMFLMRTERDRATDLLNRLLDKAAEQWIKLNPLCTELGMRKLQKLQVMDDLHASLRPLRYVRMDHMDRMTALLNFWSAKTPKIRDDLVQWNKLAAYRTYSSMLLEFMCDELWYDDENCDEIRQRMRRMNFQLRLDIGDAALKQRHRYIAEKHLTYLKGICNPDEALPLKWFEARTKYLVADIEKDVNKKLAGYAASWERSHSLLNESNESDVLDAGIGIAIREHISAMASKLESLSAEDDKFARALMSRTAILRDVGIAEPTSVDLDDVKRQLSRYSLNNFRLCCEHAAATDVGRHYCALARHCYDRLTTAESGEMFREFLHSVLKSMNHSYFEATHYFPCLLRPERLRDEETRETFARECADLQPWLFLRWRDLLFSHLGASSIADLVRPIVERLAEKYPDAIVYTYHLAVERNPEILRDGRAQRIRSLLGDKAERYKRILQAMQYVAHPILYLKYHVDELTKELSRGNATVIESLWRRICSIFFDAQTASKNKPRPGNNYIEMLAKFVKTIKALNLNDRDVMQEALKEMKQNLSAEILKGRQDELSNFSPFLLEFAGDDIEIPGQYSGDAEPRPRYHAKLAGFEPDVMIMPSLRKPIRISMIGDDGEKYKFLVKFGEDLTIDRGLQQLFATMNRTLRNDVSCGQRRLAVDTYEVIPLSRSFGLIQWIEDTKSLEDLIQFSLSQTDNVRCERIRENYSTWITRDASAKCRISDLYKKAVSKYSQQAVTRMMEHLIGQTKETALRQAFVAVSSSSECFVTLRRNFVASYATMCVAHWLAGVGDRHLQNTLVRTTGRCLGIDFGHAFGAGIRAPVPELVPFRLTPQILALLRPFTERDLLATIMTHTMRALRNDRDPILACMDIFIYKPANRSPMINDDEDDENIDAGSTWSFEKNIEIIAQKLNGIHPSFVTLEQLKETHDDMYFERYQAIVSGKDEHEQARAAVRNDCLTPAEQVDCLLDQAKDLNVLGRMYVHWQPWL